MQQLDTKCLLRDTSPKQEKWKMLPCAVRVHIFINLFLKGLMMKTLHKAFVIGAAVLGLGAASLPAIAQEAAQHHYAATKFDPVKMQERMDARAKRMHETLKITPAQEGAWQAYLSALKSNMPQRGQFDRASFKNMPAPERMEKRIEMAKARVARMESNLAATKTFYAALTPEQQKIFDEKGGRFGHRHHRRMMHHHG
ncbi:Spy/CpxP family protein refolding chaperone [Pseudoduganella sp. HUAS MS19]